MEHEEIREIIIKKIEFKEVEKRSFDIAKDLFFTYPSSKYRVMIIAILIEMLQSKKGY